MSTLETIFAERCSPDYRGHHDMLPHMQTVSDYALMCTHCTEFGVRTGSSTIALLHGLARQGLGAPPRLLSYDLNPPQFDCPDTTGVEWTFRQADTSTLADIAETDLLFIDTLHTAGQVAAELRHEHRVRRYLVFHDVIMFGTVGEAGQPGIIPPILRLLERDDWTVDRFEPSPWGLLVLRRT